MSLYFAITISLLIVFASASIYIFFSYLTYRFTQSKRSVGIQHKIAQRKRRKGKYILNNFTSRIFFGEFERQKRISILNGESPLTTEKYSFTKIKIFDN